jgi:UDP-glucose 4-epimerase
VRLAETPAAVGQVFNIGNTEEISISRLAERIRTMTGSTSEIVQIPYEEAYDEGFEDMPRRVPSLEKINALIGYQPTVQLDGILERVVAHSRAAGPAAE